MPVRPFVCAIQNDIVSVRLVRGEIYGFCRCTGAAHFQRAQNRFLGGGRAACRNQGQPPVNGADKRRVRGADVDGRRTSSASEDHFWSGAASTARVSAQQHRNRDTSTPTHQSLLDGQRARLARAWGPADAFTRRPSVAGVEPEALRHRTTPREPLAK